MFCIEYSIYWLTIVSANNMFEVYDINGSSRSEEQF